MERGDWALLPPTTSGAPAARVWKEPVGWYGHASGQWASWDDKLRTGPHKTRRAACKTIETIDKTVTAK